MSQCQGKETENHGKTSRMCSGAVMICSKCGNRGCRHENCTNYGFRGSVCTCCGSTSNRTI